MWVIGFWSLVAAFGAGAALKWYLDTHPEHGLQISRAELLGYGLAISLLIVPLSVGLGWKTAVDAKLTFNEFHNGWESGVRAVPTNCTRDGSCQHCYNCDPYLVSHTSCSGSGKTRSCTTYYTTEYHHCPYVRTEWAYYVQTTLGEYLIDSGRFPANPHSERWEPERGEDLPSSVISNAGTGYPAFWSQARERVLSGNPGPVVKRATYKNYILASDGTILQERSSDVNSFLSRQLLPAVPSNIYSHYLSDKVVFAGFVPPNARAWQDAVGKLNAALGNELRGDLLLVLVDAKKVPNADAYIMALKARWQDVTAFDRNTAAKNTIIVAVGTLDGKTAAWGRAVTGMPSGNELMTTVLNRRLAGTPLTPEAVVGSVRGQIRGQAVTSLHGNGVIESVVFGLENPATRFARVSMNGDSHGGGYLYLKGEIQPSTKAKVWIFLIALAGSLVAWGGAAFFGEPNRRRYSSVPAFRPYRGLR